MHAVEAVIIECQANTSLQTLTAHHSLSLSPLCPHRWLLHEKYILVWLGASSPSPYTIKCCTPPSLSNCCMLHTYLLSCYVEWTPTGMMHCWCCWRWCWWWWLHFSLTNVLMKPTKDYGKKSPYCIILSLKIFWCVVMFHFLLLCAALQLLSLSMLIVAWCIVL